MADARADVRASIDVPLNRGAVFAILMDDLQRSLGELGLRFTPGPDGAVEEGTERVGRVTEWRQSERIHMEWRPASWQPDDMCRLAIHLDDVDGGTRLTIEQRGWGESIGGPADAAGWFASEVVAPLLVSMSPRALGGWLTDRRARQPSGDQARQTYSAPLFHYPMFRVILGELGLTAQDHLLEVGCGGGALLRDALLSGCRASAIDHSADMVRLAREQNADAIAQGRLDVQRASADELPFPDDTFTCATMTGVFGFLPDPVAALREIHRVLRPGGRLVMAGADPELRGTPGAPEPMASYLRFYDTEETERVAREAGFPSPSVRRMELLEHAREVGIPEEYLPLFAGRSRFLLATK